jgi:diguanylate cyclase (GGDEF)-like protein
MKTADTITPEVGFLPAPPSRIMIVDDMPENLSLLRNMLGDRGFEILALPNGPMAVRAAERVVPDLVLLDITMPEMDGYEVCERFKENPRLKDVPVIFLSALTDTGDKVRAFKSGGVDFITKPFQFEEVVARVMAHLKIRGQQQVLEYRNENLQVQVDDQTRRLSDAEQKSRERLSEIAHHDQLTAIPNRLLVQDRFEQAVICADRQGLSVGLLFLDFDNFKAINETLGHASGDEILNQLAARLRTCVRATDTIGRLGGDEYLIVLRDIADNAEIEAVLKEIQRQMANPVFIAERELSVSASIGVAVYPEHGRDFTAICKNADAAMYQAKEAGRDTYRFFAPLMSVDSPDRLEMRGALKRALERNEFVLHYQPQIDLDSGAVIGAEALIRWNHPEQGLLLPGKFIVAAEQSGLIVPIGDWVLREACRQAVDWQRAGLPGIVMAVNLSAVQFKRGDLELTLQDAMNRSGIAPEFLELELTESILLKDTEMVLQMVRRLKNLGVKLAIDDFGTGYSSLAYLKKFAVDKLKIDQSFVRDLAHDPDDAAIVRAIIQMARSLNLRTIAEGVEDERTLECLRIERCDEAQGYYFAKPMPAAAFPAFVRNFKTRQPGLELPSPLK